MNDQHSKEDAELEEMVEQLEFLRSSVGNHGYLRSIINEALAVVSKRKLSRKGPAND
jgi:hypothetical protein